MVGGSVDISMQSFALAVAIFACSYAIFGMTGFGNNILAMPFLVLMIPLKFCVSLTVLLDTVFVTWMAVKFYKQANYQELAVLFPAMAVGLLLGVSTLSMLSDRVLLLSLGTFTMCYSGYALLSTGGAYRISKIAAIPFGLFGGVFSAAFGTGGPVHVMYIAGRIREKSELRATILVALEFTVVVRLGVFGYGSFLDDKFVWIWFLCLIPFCFGGIRVGHRLHNMIDGEMVLKVIQILLFISGCLLIVRNL